MLPRKRASSTDPFCGLALRAFGQRHQPRNQPWSRNRWAPGCRRSRHSVALGDLGDFEVCGGSWYRQSYFGTERHLFEEMTVPNRISPGDSIYQEHLGYPNREARLPG
jgi:hypothetical protein